MKKLLVITFLTLVASLSAFPNLKELGFPKMPGEENIYGYESAVQMQFTKSKKISFHHHHNPQMNKSVSIVMNHDMMDSTALIYNSDSKEPAEYCSSVSYYSKDTYIYRFGDKGMIIAYFLEEGKVCFYAMLFLD